LWENVTERDHYKDLSVYVRIILIRIFKKTMGDMERVDLPRNRISGGIL
jgi:hypothetical protein